MLLPRPFSNNHGSNSKQGYCLLVAFALFLCTCSVTPTASASPVTLHLAYLEDQQNHLTIDDVLTRSQQGAFTPITLTSDYINFGSSAGTLWLEVAFCEPDASQQGYLELGYAGLRLVEFYNQQGQKLVKTGRDFSLDTRPVMSRHFILPVDLNACNKKHYLKIRTSILLFFPLRLHTQETLALQILKDHLINFSYYGSLLTIAFYFLIFSVTLKEKSLFYYGTFAYLLLIANFSGYGFSRLLIWPDIASWDQVSEVFFYYLAGAASISFTQIFLKTRQILSWFHHWLNLLKTAFLVLSVLVVLSMRYDWSLIPLIQLGNLTGFATGISIILMSWQLYRQGMPSMLAFFTAWSCFWLSVAVWALTSAGLLPANYWTYNAIQLGSALELTLLSWALGQRLYLQRQEKEKALELVAISHKEKNEVLKKTRAELERAIKERTEDLQASLMKEQRFHQQFIELSGMISHELRNPLFTITTRLELLRRCSSEVTDASSPHLHAIQEACNRLIGILDQWSMNDGVNTRFMDLQLTRVDLIALIASLHERIKKIHPERPFILAKPDFDTHLHIMADSRLLELAAFNLLDNACKYSPENTPIMLGLTSANQSAGFYIKDFGQGIAEAEQALVFSDYYRCTKNLAQPGLGLGLALVKRIVDAHEGHLRLTSQPNEGSRFDIGFTRVVG